MIGRRTRGLDPLGQLPAGVDRYPVHQKLRPRLPASEDPLERSYYKAFRLTRTVRRKYRILPLLRVSSIFPGLAAG